MACCTLKPLLMADAINSSSNSSVSNKTKSHFIQTTRNSQYYFSMIRLNTRGVNLSCSTTSSRGPCTQHLLLPPPRRRPCSVTPPSFSVFNEVISSLAQCLSSNSATDDDDDHQAQDQEGKDSFVAAEAPPLLEDAFVQVICEFSASDLGRPWSRFAGIRRRTTNGFIIDIESRRLLTSAKGIEHHSNVSIQKPGSNTIYQGTVIATAHDFNLAMLTVSDDEFWEGVGSVELGDMPSPTDELTSMSYVEGMNTITSRSGFVSYVGMLPFSHGVPNFPTFEINYDSEFGESGSTIFNENGKCVGMTFDGPQSIYRRRVIPATIIKHFILDYDRNGEYTGVPIFAVKWQKMENHDLRMYMEMQHHQEGVLIIDIDRGCPELDALEPDDVILSIDGVKIANNGTVPFVGGRRIDFNYLFTQKYTGDNVHVKVLRESEIHEFSIKLATHKQLMPEDVKERPQNYYIIGGLVFTSVKIPYARACHSLLGEYDESVQDEMVYPVHYEECVVVSQVLEAEVNKGYSVVDIVNYQVRYLNYNPVKGLKELVLMVESCQDEYLVFLLLNYQIVVLPTISAKETTPKILKAYGIPSAMSNGLFDDLKTFREKEE